jgi:hypothetical protein
LSHLYDKRIKQNKWLSYFLNPKDGFEVIVIPMQGKHPMIDDRTVHLFFL